MAVFEELARLLEPVRRLIILFLKPFKQNFKVYFYTICYVNIVVYYFQFETER